MLDPPERLSLSLYIATMLYRVPRNRQRAEGLLQPALDSTVKEVREAIQHIASMGTVPLEIVARRLREVDEAYAKFSREPPREVRAQMKDPRPTEKTVGAILGMTWRVLVASPSEFFITSDNPAFFHGAYGIGTPKAELRFPLSPTLALHGTWQPDPKGNLSFHSAPKDWVREFNRSIASDASTLVFCHEKAAWLKTLLHRKKPYLFRLVWTGS